MYTALNSTISISVFVVCLGDAIYKKENMIIRAVMFGVLGISDAMLFPHLYYKELNRTPGDGSIGINHTFKIYLF